VKFLIDNALPPQLATLLRKAGHDALLVRGYRMQAAPDHAILDRALNEDRVIVSADSDFAAILAIRNAARPSFVLFREPELVTAGHYADRLLGHLSGIEAELNKGSVVVFRSGRVRIRNLPFSD